MSKVKLKTSSSSASSTVKKKGTKGKKKVANDVVRTVPLPVLTEEPKEDNRLNVSPTPENYCDQRVGFVKYVSTSGLKAAVVRSIVALYELPVKPNKPLEFIRYFLGAGVHTKEELQAEQDYVIRLRKQVEELEEENTTLNQRIQELQLALLNRQADTDKEEENNDKIDTNVSAAEPDCIDEPLDLKNPSYKW